MLHAGMCYGVSLLDADRASLFDADYHSSISGDLSSDLGRTTNTW
jgi:hypothetical protein